MVCLSLQAQRVPVTAAHGFKTTGCRRTVPHSALLHTAGAGRSAASVSKVRQKNVNNTVLSCYNVPRLQRIHRYKVLFPRSRFHVMENSSVRIQRTIFTTYFFPTPWEYVVTRLECIVKIINETVGQINVLVNKFSEK